MHVLPLMMSWFSNSRLFKNENWSLHFGPQQVPRWIAHLVACQNILDHYPLQGMQQGSPVNSQLMFDGTQLNIQMIIKILPLEDVSCVVNSSVNSDMFC